MSSAVTDVINKGGNQATISLAGASALCFCQCIEIGG